MKHIANLVSRFGTSLRLDRALIVERQGRYFLLNRRLMDMISGDFFHAGTYLGKVKRGVFFPSFSLLAIVASRKDANKVMVDQRSEWLFIVGRDIFRRGILKLVGSMRKGAYTLVVNQHDECLGFGRILHDLNEREDKSKVVVRNVSDIGDFLRRERRERVY